MFVSYTTPLATDRAPSPSLSILKTHCTPVPAPRCSSLPRSHLVWRPHFPLSGFALVALAPIHHFSQRHIEGRSLCREARQYPPGPFFLLVLGVFLIDRMKPDLKPFLKSALIAFLTILKIFPLATVAVLVRNRKAALIALLAAAFSIAALVITCGHRLPQVLANTPQDLIISFGSLPFFLAIFTHTSHRLLWMV